MASFITLPDLNEGSNFRTKGGISMVKKIIWLKETGDVVKKGDVICEIEYGKFVLEHECFDNGILLFQNTKTEIRFHDILFVVGEKDEEFRHLFDENDKRIKEQIISGKKLNQEIFKIENTYESQNSGVLGIFKKLFK